MCCNVLKYTISPCVFFLGTSGNLVSYHRRTRNQTWWRRWLWFTQKQNWSWSTKIKAKHRLTQQFIHVNLLLCHDPAEPCRLATLVTHSQVQETSLKWSYTAGSITAHVHHVFPSPSILNHWCTWDGSMFPGCLFWPTQHWWTGVKRPVADSRGTCSAASTCFKAPEMLVCTPRLWWEVTVAFLSARGTWPLTFHIKNTFSPFCCSSDHHQPSLFPPFWHLVWTSAGHLDHVCMSKCIDLLPCDIFTLTSNQTEVQSIKCV